MKQVLLLSLALLLVACEKAPMNGALDGQWQLLSYETADGEIQNCYRLYYSIQLQVVELADKGGSGKGTFIGRFAYDENRSSVVIRELRYRSNESRLATLEDLQPFGLFRTETTFHVVEADRHRLVLQSADATLRFRKF